MPVEGYKWLLLADRAGMPDSKGVREKAAEKISAADRKRAEALATSFVARPERPLERRRRGWARQTKPVDAP